MGNQQTPGKTTVTKTTNYSEESADFPVDSNYVRGGKDSVPATGAFTRRSRLEGAFAATRRDVVAESEHGVSSQLEVAERKNCTQSIMWQGVQLESIEIDENLKKLCLKEQSIEVLKRKSERSEVRRSMLKAVYNLWKKSWKRRHDGEGVEKVAVDRGNYMERQIRASRQKQRRRKTRPRETVSRVPKYEESVFSLEFPEDDERTPAVE